MFKTFTKEDSLRYLYGEMELFEQFRFKIALESDSALRVDFYKLKEIVCLLNTNFNSDPSLVSISLIKSFASSFEFFRTKFGNFDQILN
jgi:hypothetical protein